MGVLGRIGIWRVLTNLKHGWERDYLGEKTVLCDILTEIKESTRMRVDNRDSLWKHEATARAISHDSCGLALVGHDVSGAHLPSASERSLYTHRDRCLSTLSLGYHGMRLCPFCTRKILIFQSVTLKYDCA